MRFSLSGQRGMRLALAIAALSLLPLAAQAQTYNWSNLGSGAYATPGNWAPSGPPTVGSDVVVNNNGTVQFASGEAYLNTIMLGGTAGSSGTLAMTGGLIDMFPGGIKVGEQGTGVVTIDNATLSTGDGSIYVGGQFGGGTGTLTLSGNASSLSSTDNFSIGRQGTGTFNLNGGYATSDFATIGKFGTGVWNQTGGVFVQTSGDFEIGDGGTPAQTGTSGPRSGTLNLSGGVIQTSGFFAISNRRATGTVNVSGGAIAATGVVGNGAIIIGRGMSWDTAPNAAGTGGPTAMRVTGDDAVIIANGDFEMNVFDISSSATLIAEITGPTHTPIKVMGNARIGNGTFKVELDGYTPVSGDSWTILSAGVADLSAEKTAIDSMLASMEQSPLTHQTSSVPIGTLQGEFKSTDFSLAPLSAGLEWNVAYANNSVVLSVTGSAPAYAADFNNDGRVDGLDLAAWKSAYGQPANGADANDDGRTDGADFLIWQREFGSGVTATPAVGAVPEPASIALIGLAAMGLAAYGRARRA